MSLCGKCYHKSQLFLCNGCIEALRKYLNEIAWLMEQLDVTITRQDRLSTGSVGHSSDNPSPINFGAMEVARKAANTIGTWVRDLCESRGIEFMPKRFVSLDFIGPLQADQQRTRSYRPKTLVVEMAEWLAEHVSAIALSEAAGECYRDMDDLRLEILRTVNRPDRHFAGPCPTIKGHKRNGAQIICGEYLYAGSEDMFTKCPKCDASVDVKANRLRALHDGDLMTERVLLKRLAELDEAIPRVTFYQWIRKRKVQIKGYMHRGTFVEHYIQRGDPRVFSCREVRQVRKSELKAAEKNSTDPTPKESEKLSS